MWSFLARSPPLGSVKHPPSFVKHPPSFAPRSLECRAPVSGSGHVSYEVILGYCEYMAMPHALTMERIGVRRVGISLLSPPQPLYRRKS